MGDMYSDAPTEETAVGESEDGSDLWESDDALMMEGVQDPVYDNSAAPYYYGVNYMQAQPSTVHADRAHLGELSDEDQEALYDNAKRRASQGIPMMNGNSLYDNRGAMMALNMPSTLQEVMKTFYSGEDYLKHGSDSEEETEEEDVGSQSSAGGGAAAATGGHGAAPEGGLHSLHAASLGENPRNVTSVRGTARGPGARESDSGDIMAALNQSALADSTMAEAEF